MVQARLLVAVGIVVVVGGIVGGLAAQAPASPASNGTRLAALPDNPCGLLTREQVAVATGLDIAAVLRVPDIRQVVDAQDAGLRENGVVNSIATGQSAGV